MLHRFLDRCDLVKFAKLRPATDAAIETLEVGRDFVQRTTGWTPPPGPDPDPAESRGDEAPQELPGSGDEPGVEAAHAGSSTSERRY